MVTKLFEKADIRTMRKDLQQLRGIGIIKKREQITTPKGIKEPVKNAFSMPASNNENNYVNEANQAREKLEVKRKDLSKISQIPVKESEKSQQKETGIKIVPQQKKALENPLPNQISSTPTTLGIFNKPEEKIKERPKITYPEFTEKLAQEKPSFKEKIIIKETPKLEQATTPEHILVHSNNVPQAKEDLSPVKSKEASQEPKEGQTPNEMKEVPLTPKEKLSEPEKNKGEKRKSFMDDIEEWINSSNKNIKNNITNDAKSTN